MILISSCLIGEYVRYDGGSQGVTRLIELINEGKAIHACPELLGGLNVPREPAEIIGGDGFDVLDGKAKVLTVSDKDVTEAFLKGAEATLKILLAENVDTVILKANSPSCGNKQIYDGTFSGIKKQGAGVTSALLERNGIKVMSEQDYFSS
ncbi:DUF523 domain-containing protein [Macrococcoides bohemicum]|uniref:DUF523 domain-containing protein n=1 Tax=Macrococcoides bohemicum TaxID=1903056 RepID=A0AAJ4P991_9STAP|nr:MULTISPECIES: DUF523 domain-containing protein [Macrococcus]ATD31018.1 hypothetical protein BHM04_07380 [Macrococcus sp. IME1552]QYA43007.1 DUF523 domain-containing protein [Macrococcus bohemicus]QYA45358.1 DUF523 domain-containing protein [Macrococcus bohemicus]